VPAAEEAVLEIITFDLLIFDMDGVLVDTGSCHSQAFTDLWQEVGIQGPPYHTIAGRKTAEVVAEFTAALAPSPTQICDWVAFKQRRARRYISTAALAYNDTTPALRALARYGFRLALGTSASRDTATLILDRMGLRLLFSVIVTAEDVVDGKPSPETYSRVMDHARVSPGKTLVIEDSMPGLQAATASKAFAASVRTGAVVDHPRFVGSFSGLSDLLLALGIAL
jgi:HAD superfamily hydrolase (TIGR01509 family)